MKESILLVSDCIYLSDYLEELPANCLFNKGVTGCGGTHLELHLSKRNSLILVPTIELVKNKLCDGIFGFYGDVSINDLISYITSDIPYKKIIGTYDCLPRFMDVIANYSDYFLLVDEYHLLFNLYGFRTRAVFNILNNFSKFKKFCFMTATPLKEEFILPQLKELDRITLNWSNAISVNIKIKDTYFIVEELLKELRQPFTGNYHIFLNSVATIQRIVKKLDSTDYRVVCSDFSKKKYSKLKVASTKDPVCKYNFYTSYCSEGCDIYDEYGKTIIVSDTNQSQTLNDISTTIPQICGRLRNSNYKDSILFIVNTKEHRYLSDNKNNYKSFIENQRELGLERLTHLNGCSQDLHSSYMLKFRKNVYDYYDMYINLNENNNEFFSDKVLQLRDVYTFELLSGIYSSSFNILSNINTLNNFTANIEIPRYNKFSIVTPYLEDREYTYQELKDAFSAMFKNKGIEWNDRTTIKNYFPEFTKRLRKMDGKPVQVYKFNLY